MSAKIMLNFEIYFEVGFEFSNSNHATRNLNKHIIAVTSHSFPSLGYMN
jgi:hypothetical protein